MKHLQGALGWSLVGLLLTYVLINVIGFASPFWGYLLDPEGPRGSLDLLHFWQPLVPWFSVCFAIAAWHLALTVQSRVGRTAIVAMGILMPVAHIGSSLARLAIKEAESPVPPQFPALVDMFAGGYIGLFYVAFLAFAWRAVRQSTRSFTPGI